MDRAPISELAGWALKLAAAAWTIFADCNNYYGNVDLQQMLQLLMFVYDTLFLIMNYLHASQVPLACNINLHPLSARVVESEILDEVRGDELQITRVTEVRGDGYGGQCPFWWRWSAIVHCLERALPLGAGSSTLSSKSWRAFGFHRKHLYKIWKSCVYAENWDTNLLWDILLIFDQRIFVINFIFHYLVSLCFSL